MGMSLETRVKWMLARTKHGAWLGGEERPEHYVWRSMLARCGNPNDKAYHRYGGRGIAVCSEWQDYCRFVSDMGLRPSPKHSLDRRENDKGYSKDNCRWATATEQAKNQSDTKHYTDGNFVGTPAECAEHIGISRALAAWRMRVWGTYQKGISWRKLPKQK